MQQEAVTNPYLERMNYQNIFQRHKGKTSGETTRYWNVTKPKS